MAGEKVLDSETCVQILPLTHATFAALISLSTIPFMHVLNGDETVSPSGRFFGELNERMHTGYLAQC